VNIKFDEKTLFSLPHLTKKRVEEFQAYNEKKHLEVAIRDHIKKYNNVDDDNVVHKLILEKHNRINYKKFKLKKDDDYYVKPIIKWNIEQISSQSYIAHKVL
jgi:hypothetical protein